MKKIKVINTNTYQLGDYRIEQDKDSNNYWIREYNRMLSYWEVKMYLTPSELKNAIRLLQAVEESK